MAWQSRLLRWNILQVEKSLHIMRAICSNNDDIIITKSCIDERLKARICRKTVLQPQLHPSFIWWPCRPILHLSPDCCAPQEGWTEETICNCISVLPCLQLPALVDRCPRGENRRKRVQLFIPRSHSSKWLWQQGLSSHQVVLSTQHTTLGSSNFPSGLGLLLFLAQMCTIP